MAATTSFPAECTSLLEGPRAPTPTTQSQFTKLQEVGVPNRVLTQSSIFSSQACQENVPHLIVYFILVAKLYFRNLSVPIKMSHSMTSEMKRKRNPIQNTKNYSKLHSNTQAWNLTCYYHVLWEQGLLTGCGRKILGLETRQGKQNAGHLMKKQEATLTSPHLQSPFLISGVQSFHGQGKAPPTGAAFISMQSGPQNSSQGKCQ